MRVVKELHKLKHPLHEYMCRRIPTADGEGVYVVLDTFDFSSVPFEREYLYTNCTTMEARSLVSEISTLIDAARKVAT